MGLFGKPTLAAPPSPEGIGQLVALAALGVALARGKFPEALGNELIGAFFIVVLTCTPGVGWGASGDVLMGVPADWVYHAAGVILTDFATGAQCNPGVTLTMWCLGKLDLAEGVMRVVGQSLGATAGFLFCNMVSSSLGWGSVSFPEVPASLAGDALTTLCTNELIAMVMLCVAIYVVAFEAPNSWSSSSHYYFTKTLGVASAIRAIITFFPTSLNPALALGWALASSGGQLPPIEHPFWVVYWLASLAGAVVAAAGYTLYLKNK